jgi:hypothetical protein
MTISAPEFMNFSKMGKYKAHDFPDQYNDFHGYMSVKCQLWMQYMTTWHHNTEDHNTIA